LKTSLVTGNPFDYISLTPESLPEACDIIRTRLSEFPREKDRIAIVFDISGKSMEMRIRISDIQTKQDPSINVAHDQTA
jgi:hypothetical protein